METRQNPSWSLERSHCLDVLMDLLCYEIVTQRLSSEMRLMLGTHLKECLVCQDRFHNFMEVLQTGSRAGQTRIQ